MTPVSRLPDPPSATIDGRVLVFELGPERFAIPVSAVSELVELGPLRAVPDAPATVAGLTAWRGTILTVLDLSRVLGRPAGTGPACLIRLAPPLERAAWLVRATLKTINLPCAPVVDSTLDLEGRPVRVLDSPRLVRGTETVARERG